MKPVTQGKTEPKAGVNRAGLLRRLRNRGFSKADSRELKRAANAASKVLGHAGHTARPNQRTSNSKSAKPLLQDNRGWKPKTATGRKFVELRHQFIAQGGELLDAKGIAAEQRKRRGGLA